ncbi:MAG: hypothetical protein L6V95_08020 [Candidatus Melainabacteria bacterium]|nr:MAG: hypothetical protein L6V95_08020 [Candidatus Melainabacteria bacterium]
MEKLLFGGSSLNITGQENVAHNVVLKGTEMTFWGGEKMIELKIMQHTEISMVMMEMTH